MKKFLVIVFSIFLVVGCSLNKNTPKEKTIEFLKKYQGLDKEVMDDLEFVTEGTTLTREKDKESYMNAIKMQYSDLKYEVLDESISGDEAVVKVKINVYDFYKVQKDADEYKSTHESEFLTNDVYDNFKFIEYKLKNMNLFFIFS